MSSSLNKVMDRYYRPIDLSSRARGDDLAAIRRAESLFKKTFGDYKIYDDIESARNGTERVMLLRQRSLWSNMLHEVAHYQLATPRRRKLPTFGLGEDVDMIHVGRPVLVSTKAAVVEECYASFLGILWEAKLGLDYAYTLPDHSWYPREGRFPPIEGLIRLGFVKDGEPVMRLRKRGEKLPKCLHL